MTLNTISDPPASPGPAPTPHTALPSTAGAAPPAPALLTSSQLMAALGLTRRMLKKWNHRLVIPSTGRGRARRYELPQVMEALWAHGQPDTAASSEPSSTTPGMGGPSGLSADC